VMWLLTKWKVHYFADYSQGYLLNSHIVISPASGSEQRIHMEFTCICLIAFVWAMFSQGG
jgi:hypothetical protein